MFIHHEGSKYMKTARKKEEYLFYLKQGTCNARRKTNIRQKKNTTNMYKTGRQTDRRKAN